MKYGRLPALMPAGLRDLSYYSPGPLPAPPAKVEVPDVADWQMLGNDEYGDCGVACLEHGFMADASVTRQAESFPTDQEAVDYYLAYTHGQDGGVVLSAYPGYVRQHGYLGHKVSAYAPVDVHNLPLLHTAIDLYDFAYTGIVVTDGMMQAFQGDGQWATPQLETPVDGATASPSSAMTTGSSTA